KAPREIADDEWPILGERRWECWNLELVPIANALVVLLGREHQREHAVLDQRLAMRAPERAREHGLNGQRSQDHGRIRTTASNTLLLAVNVEPTAVRASPRRETRVERGERPVGERLEIGEERVGLCTPGNDVVRRDLVVQPQQNHAA